MMLMDFRLLLGFLLCATFVNPRRVNDDVQRREQHQYQVRQEVFNPVSYPQTWDNGGFIEANGHNIKQGEFGSQQVPYTSNEYLGAQNTLAMNNLYSNTDYLNARVRTTQPSTSTQRMQPGYQQTPMHTNASLGSQITQSTNNLHVSTDHQHGTQGTTQPSISHQGMPEGNWQTLMTSSPIRGAQYPIHNQGVQAGNRRAPSSGFGSPNTQTTNNFPSTNNQASEHETIDPSFSQHVPNNPGIPPTNTRTQNHPASPKRHYSESTAKSMVKLALGVSRETAITEQSWASKNVAFGPLTIAGALAVVLLASMQSTFDEIASLMGYHQMMPYHDVNNDLACFFHDYEAGLNDGYNEIKYAIGLFVQDNYPVRQEFQKLIQQIYNTTAKQVNFRNQPAKAQNTINQWVSKLTNSKIKTLFNGPLPAHTNVVIASVMYFKAAWDQPFFNDQTKPRPFFSNGRNNTMTGMVEMMYNAGDFPYFKDRNLNVEIMGFPYKGKRTTMYVIVPQDSNVNQLGYLEKNLTADDIQHLIASTVDKEAIVGFPKVKIESSINLKGALNSLNVRSLFNPNQANLGLLSNGARLYANVLGGTTEQLIFPRFDDSFNCNSSTALINLESIRNEVLRNGTNPGLYADEIVHKVYIEITESGTEAAAVTGISLNRSGGRIVFRLDVPFLFFIYDEEAKVILFWGSFKSPP